MNLKFTASSALFLVLFSVPAKSQSYDTNNVMVQTLAGSGFTGYLDGQGAQTMFSSPVAIVADTSGNLFVWDNGNSRIRKITPDGTVSTFVSGGSQSEGYGTNVSLSIYAFCGMTIDRSNRLWFLGQYYIPFLMSVGTDSYVSIENAGLTNLSVSSSFCFDSANNLYYSGSYKIYRYNPAAGVSQVFVGSDNNAQQDGSGIFCSFASPGKMAADLADNIYVLDGQVLRKIDQGLNVTTITNIPGNPVAVDSFGNVILVGGGNNASYICKLTTATNILYYAGTPNFSSGGYTNGPGNLARFNNAASACLSQGSIFVADTGNQRIRQITFNQQPQVISNASLGIRPYMGITITGAVGRTYQVQSSADTTNWTTRATVLLSSSPYLWIDQGQVSGNKFYRAVLLP